jgi:hypothetical protein
VKLAIRRGGIDGESEHDRGLLKASKDHSVRMLDCEMTVIEGPFARRKVWQMYTVQGGKLDDKGVSIGWKISKSAFRAMIDSALGLSPRFPRRPRRTRHCHPRPRSASGTCRER